MENLNKIVTYYQPHDERLSEYYFEHIKLLGLDKQPFGLDQHGTLRFEKTDTNSKIWQDYKALGNFQEGVGDLNEMHRRLQKGVYTLEEFMQFYREDGCSLSFFLDVFSSKFYLEQDRVILNNSLEKLKKFDTFDLAKEEVLETVFGAHMSGTEDTLIFNYHVKAKEIISANFGKETWIEFIDKIKQKNITDD